MKPRRRLLKIRGVLKRTLHYQIRKLRKSRNETSWCQCVSVSSFSRLGHPTTLWNPCRGICIHYGNLLQFGCFNDLSPLHGDFHSAPEVRYANCHAVAISHSASFWGSNNPRACFRSQSASIGRFPQGFKAQYFPCPERHGRKGCGKTRFRPALYQGTTSVVPTSLLFLMFRADFSPRGTCLSDFFSNL